MTFGERIVELREEAGLNKLQLCSKIGIAHSQLRNLESGKVKKPSFHLVYRLSAVFNVSLDSWADYIDVWENQVS